MVGSLAWIGHPFYYTQYMSCSSCAGVNDADRQQRLLCRSSLQSQACSVVRKDFNSDGNQHRPGDHSDLYCFLEPSSQHILRKAEYGRTSIAILKSTIRGRHSASWATLKPSQVLCSSLHASGCVRDLHIVSTGTGGGGRGGGGEAEVKDSADHNLPTVGFTQLLTRRHPLAQKCPS